MNIVDVKEATVPLGSAMRNAYIDFRQMTTSMVAIVTNVSHNGSPIVGYGFNSNGRYGVGGLLRERFIPRLMGADPKELVDEAGTNLDPHAIWQLLMSNEKPGGHGERSVAIGTLDMALWDAVAKVEDKPLYQLLAERYGDSDPDKSVYVYAAGGYYYPGKDNEALQDEMRGYLQQGYDAVKMKIGGASLEEDLRRIESVLDVLSDSSALAVDANGRLDLTAALRYAEALEPYGLRWYEEPGDPLDYELQAEVARNYAGPMATGENLFSMQDVRNLVRYAELDPEQDVLQFDCALSYGLVEYMRTLEMLREHFWSPRHCIPHGGHQMSLNIAAGLGLGGNESYPGVFQPFGGFADDTPVEDGYVQLPEVPGVGFEAKSDLLRFFQQTLPV